MKKNPMLLTIIFIISILGCKNSNSTDNSNNIFSRVNVSDAKAIMTTYGGNSSGLSRVNADGTPEKLFKKTADGYVMEVSFYDESGNEITNLILPDYVYVLNSSYTMLVFESTYDLVIIENQTGNAMTLFGIEYLPRNNFFFSYSNDKHIRVVGNTIYYIGMRLDNQYESFALWKLDISASGLNPTEINNDFNKSIDSFAVNNDGSLIYSYSLKDGYATISRGVELFTNSGTLVSIETNLEDGPIFWTDNNGNLVYSYEAITGSDAGYDLYTRYFQIYSTDGSLLHSREISGLYDEDRLGGNLHIYKYDDSVVLTGGNTGLKVLNTDYSISELSGLPTLYSTRSILRAQSSDDKIYMSCQDDEYNNNNVTEHEYSLMYVYDINSQSNSLLTSDEYVFYDYSVTDDETLTFTGYRISDNMNIVGEISPSGVISIIDEGTNFDTVDVINE